ncbi:MAG: hypothetical protein HRT73_11135 [Flavobacteriales bacterium]|nr:hypothetical protein [Flavobacteriales bacterium]
MKNLLTYLILLIVISAAVGCSAQTLTDVLNQSKFNETEKEDIIKLVDFFENQILIEGKSRKESYEIILVSENEGYNRVTDMIPIEKQRKAFKGISSSAYNNIWLEGKGRIYTTYDGVKVEKPISYKSIGISTDGKYIKLLKKLGKGNEKIKHYYNSIMDSGDIPLYPNLFGLLVDINANWTEDVEQSHWRLIIAIHMLTINEQHNRYKSIKATKN